MLLEVRDLSVSYGDIEAVHGINFNVEKGELISIIGANGAGKSTTLRAIMGVQEVRSGRITFEGMDITHMPAHKRARLGIRIVPERARCFPQLTVFENLQMGVYGEQAALKKELDGIYELFPVLRERSGQYANTLSGGEQQRVSIARALAKNPKILLCDEPTGALDYSTGKNILKLLQESSRKNKQTVILITHNQAIAPMADKVIYLKNGKVQKIVSNPSPVPAERIEW